MADFVQGLQRQQGTVVDNKESVVNLSTEKTQGNNIRVTRR